MEKVITYKFFDNKDDLSEVGNFRFLNFFNKFENDKDDPEKRKIYPVGVYTRDIGCIGVCESFILKNINIDKKYFEIDFYIEVDESKLEQLDLKISDICFDCPISIGFIREMSENIDWEKVKLQYIDFDNANGIVMHYWIYTITTLMFLKADIKKERIVGWFSNYNHSRETVEKNYCDINEGDYNFAVIEKTYEGLYPYTECFWFKWDKEKEEYIYDPECVPKELKSVSNFGIG